jgi:hypothetical protein
VTTLRSAIEQSNHDAGADTIQFDAGLAPGSTIMLLSDGAYQTALHITDDVTVDGSAVTGLALDAQYERRYFLVNYGSSLSLNDLTLERGAVVGASYVSLYQVRKVA